ncbi:MAG: CapA family protein [Clostridiales bacterium]|nr:CapA family protein [Clostridiales bacterium]
MKKLTAIILAILILLPAAGCKKAPADNVVSIETPVPHATSVPAGMTEPPYEDTAEPTALPETEPPASGAPTAAPTAVPTEVPTEEPFVPASVEEAIARYEAYPLEYETVDRDKEQPNRPITEPRYKQGSDGVYRSSESSDGQDAVIMLTGDLMCQTRQQEAGKTPMGYSFDGSFDYVRRILKKADLVVGNLEATLSESAPYMAELIEVETRPHLNAPATFLEAIRGAGFDLVVMSNNHNVDTGVRGIYDTLDRVDEYKLMHTGLFRNSEECRYIVVEVNGIKVGFMSYATYFNTKEAHLTPEGVRILLNPYSKEVVERDVAAVKAAGAEYVIVYIHWGTEYVNEPDPIQVEWAQELADAGVDYIIGSHPHALQPYDQITASDGRTVPVVYSMGNFLSHQKKVVTKDTLILRIRLARNSKGKVVLKDEGYIPCRVFLTFDGRDYAIVPVVSPYNNGMYSSYFAPAYERITGIMGEKIRVLGTP